MTVFNKTGVHMKGKSPPARIPDVEQVLCTKQIKGSTRNHELVNSPTGITRCRWCRSTWADLDEQTRNEAIRLQVEKPRVARKR